MAKIETLITDIYKMLEDKHSIGKEYEWDDWDSDITYKQIYQIYGRGDGYHPLKCETIESLGFCLKEDCPHYVEAWKPKKLRS